MTKTDIQIVIGIVGLAFTYYTFYKANKVVDTVAETTHEVGSKIGLGLYDAKETVKGWLGLENDEAIVKKAIAPIKTPTQVKADALYDELVGRYDSHNDPYGINADADRLKAKDAYYKKMGWI